MLRVNIKSLVIDNAGGNILNIVQWVHKHNKFRSAWDISFRPDDAGKTNIFLETNDAQIMDAVQAEWPDAQIQNIQFEKAV